MLNILHNYNFDNLVRTDKKVKVTDPATTIKSGMVCKLDSNGEVVLTGANGAVENVVYWAFTSANDTDENRGDFRITGKITLLQGVFPAETDQYDVNASYSVGTKLTTENGILIPASTGDYVCARVTRPPVGGKLEILAAPRPSVA